MTERSLPCEGAMQNPPHLGRIIRLDCIEPVGLSIGEAAEALSVTRGRLRRGR
jgi:antitoxin HigA-1